MAPKKIDVWDKIQKCVWSEWEVFLSTLPADLRFHITHDGKVAHMGEFLDMRQAQKRLAVAWFGKPCEICPQCAEIERLMGAYLGSDKN